MLIADEIQCGLGRTGRWFAYQHFAIKPDVVTIAKPLAAGLPLGAILTTNEVARCIKPGLHGTTFGGGPLSCAVAIAVVDTIEREGLLAHVNEIGAYMKAQLALLQSRHPLIREVRALGVMAALELSDGDAAKFAVAECLKRGVIINRTHEVVLRLLPPFIVQKKHVDLLVKTLDAVLSSWGTQRKSTERSKTAHAGH